MAMPFPLESSTRLRTPDGAHLVLQAHGDASRAEWLILVLPAMGAPAGAYARLGDALADLGHAVFRIDLRGFGSSSERASLGHDWGYRELIEIDLPLALEHLRLRHPGKPVAVLGHSLGGQLAVQAAAGGHWQPDALMLVAAGSAWLQAWSGLARWRYRLLILAVQLSLWCLPWYPGSMIGFGGDQPRRFMRDWLRNARLGRYPIGAGRADASPTGMLRVLALGIEGDSIAPRAALSDLLRHLPSALVTHRELAAARGETGWKRHFSWLRRPRSVAELCHAWLQARQSALPRRAPFPLPKAA